MNALEKLAVGMRIVGCLLRAMRFWARAAQAVSAARALAARGQVYSGCFPSERSDAILVQMKALADELAQVQADVAGHVARMKDERARLARARAVRLLGKSEHTVGVMEASSSSASGASAQAGGIDDDSAWERYAAEAEEVAKREGR